jgi:hypothetical protein
MPNIHFSENYYDHNIPDLAIQHAGIFITFDIKTDQKYSCKTIYKYFPNLQYVCSRFIPFTNTHERS